MRVIVCGSRTWDNPHPIWQSLERIAEQHPDAEIIHGAARGADSLADAAAKALGLKVTPVPADWEKFGKAAGPMRNKQMLDLAPDRLLAFRCPGQSKGTDHMITIARRAGVPCWVTDPDGRVHHLPKEH